MVFQFQFTELNWKYRNRKSNEGGKEICLLFSHFHLLCMLLTSQVLYKPAIAKCIHLKKENTRNQFSSVAQSCPTLCDPMNRRTPGLPVITNSWSLLKFMSIKSVMQFNHLILCHPLLLLPSVFHSIRVFSNEWAFRIGWPKYWNFSIRISNEYSGLISFRTDWFDLLVVQRTLKNLLQRHSSKASTLWCSAFFMVQLSHSYRTIGNHNFD